MIDSVIPVFYELGTGSRATYVSMDALLIAQANLSIVRSRAFKNPSSQGVTNSASVLNTQMVRTSSPAHIPSDSASAATYDSGKTILLRQHLAFWTSQSYTFDSQGDGVNPGTPYTVNLFAYSMPQMRQQSAAFLEFSHSLTGETGFSFLTTIGTGVKSISKAWSDVSVTNFANTIETDNFAGSEIHNWDVEGALTVYDQRTPRKVGGGYFTRAIPPGPSDGALDLDPAPFDWIDNLNDKVIAGSRNQYGYGNTSNGGLSSYSAHVCRWQESEIGIGLVTRSNPPVQNCFTGLASPTAFMNLTEPPTDEASAYGSNTTLPSITSASLAIRSDIPYFLEGSRTLWQRGQIGQASNPITIYHRIEDLRVGYLASQDSAFANPEEPLHI